MIRRDWILFTPHEMVRNIVCRVAREAGVTPDDIYGDSRKAHIARARAAAMHLSRKRLGYSYPKLGKIFNRDHTTIIHAINRVQANPEKYPIGVYDGMD